MTTNNLQRRAILLILAILVPPCLDARKSGGGGGGFRGSSGARTSGASGGAGAGGGFRPQPAGGGFHGGAAPGGNFRPPSGGGPGHFGGGSGLGSASRGASFKTALAGAALGAVTGIVAFEAGKAIINSFDRPFHYGDRDYYWGSEYMRKRPGEFQCSMPFDTLVQQSNPSSTTQPPEASNGTAATPDQALAHATFPNGTRPKQIVWSCKERVEVCCGTDCCPNQQYTNSSEGSTVTGTIGKVLLGIFVVGLLLCCCCGLIIYKFCREAFDKIMPRSNYQASSTNNNNDLPKYDSPGGAQQYPQQAYPMHPYPSAGPTYPAQPQPPPTYPPAPAAYPPAPGYYEQNKY